MLDNHNLLKDYDKFTSYPAMKDKFKEKNKWTDSEPVIRCKNLITS